MISALHSPESNPSREAFDLSHRKVLTFKVGELLPILMKEMVPKDYVEVDVAALVRSVMPLNTAAFMRCKLHLDFFFTPMTAVWRNFDKFYYQRDDNYTSYTRGFAYEPNCKLSSIIRAIQEGSTTSPVDSDQARAKIANLLGYGNWRDAVLASYEPGGSNEAVGAKSLTALPWYVYNRIFNLWYRDAWRDQPGLFDVDSMSADNIVCNDYATSIVDMSAAESQQTNYRLKVHYHKYPMDLFMGLLPSQQFGTVSQVSFSDNNIINLRSLAQGASNLDNVGIRTSAALLADVDRSSNTTSWRGVGDLFSVIELRKVIAAQKWKEYNMRAGWKSSKQAKAMFGVNTPDDRKHDVEFIDGYQFPIMVDEVVSQTNTTGSGGNSELGELAGKVIGVGNGHKIKFTSGERFGYFTCIAYILPQVDYNANGIDKQLVRSVPEDHYMPAYQNLGLEPVFKFELNGLGNPNVFDSTLGYATRYHEYKTETDKVYADFITNKPLQSWVTVRRDLENIVNNGSIPVSYLYVKPSILDSLFFANADHTLNTDQFMVNFNFDLKMVRPMSALGLPTL